MAINPTFLALGAANPGLLPLAFMGGGGYGGSRLIDYGASLSGWRLFLFGTFILLLVTVFVIALIALGIGGLLVGAFCFSAFPLWGAIAASVALALLWVGCIAGGMYLLLMW